MVTREIDNFNLKQIAESGQCFRWEQIDDAGFKYRIIAEDKYIEVEQVREKTFSFHCNEQMFRYFWESYFDLGTDYTFRPEEDYCNPLIQSAAAAGSGIRILRQNPWEMLVTFLTAQNISIDRVTTLIGRLCQEYGEKLHTESGAIYYAFPEPQILAKIQPQDLRRLGFGYRDKQIVNAAKITACEAVDLYRLREADHDTAKLVLTNIFGVGDKVAECICLFGLHQLEAYPIDTWVKKIEAYFGEGYIQQNYGMRAGLIQQYLFAYVRQHGLPEETE